jgi:hypothetical protein
MGAGDFLTLSNGTGYGTCEWSNCGDPKDLTNVYYWSMVRLNLPGSELYDPSMAWVAKICPDGRMAADLFIYMDDFTPTGAR